MSLIATTTTALKDVRYGNHLPAFFCLAALVANHSLFRLGAMPFVWLPLIVLALGAVVVLAPQFERVPVTPGRVTLSNLLIGAVIGLPALASLVLGWNREFPYSGDQSFQLKQAFYMVYWWASPIGSKPVGILGPTLDAGAFKQLLVQPWQLIWSRAVVLAAIVAATVWGYRRFPFGAFLFAAAALLTWAMFERAIYLRYPGGGYVLAMPFTLPAFALGNLEFTFRIPNVAACFVWLFVLRPWLVGRWPDVRVLPVAAFLFWHKDVVYYLDSAYLEPWAFVLSLLTIELIIAHGRAAAPLACLIVGITATIKEPLIFVLPFVWLAGAPWSLPRRELMRLTGAAIAAGVPFVLYFFARKNVGLADLVTDRLFILDLSREQFSNFIYGFWLQMIAAYPLPSAVVAISGLGATLFLLFRDNERRWPLACAFTAGLFVIGMMMIDRFGVNWAGNSRYFLYALSFLAAGGVALGYYLKPRTALAVGIVVLLLQSSSAYLAVARSAGPSSDRNFVEHYDAPLVFPIKSLIAEATRSGVLAPGAAIVANRPDDAVRPVPGVNVAFEPLGELRCACSEEFPRVMTLFVRYTNLSSPFIDKAPVDEDQLFVPPYGRDKIWRSQREARPMCIAKLRQTCRQVLVREESGEIVGALGVR